MPSSNLSATSSQALGGCCRGSQSPPSSRLDKPHATSVVPWSLQVTKTLTAQKPGHQCSCEVHKHPVTVSSHNPLWLRSHWYNPEAIRPSGPTIHSNFSLRPARHFPPSLFQRYSSKAKQEPTGGLTWGVLAILIMVIIGGLSLKVSFRQRSSKERSLSCKYKANDASRYTYPLAQKGILHHLRTNK